MPEDKPNKPPPPAKPRPQMPPGEPPNALSGENFHVIDDESDLVSFSPAAPSASSQTRQPPPAAKPPNLFLRRTLVPILLTGGIELTALGILWFRTAADSPFRLMGIELPIGLIAVGAIFLTVGILNVLSLRRALREPSVLKHASPNQ